MTETLTTSGAVKLYAGANVNSSISAAQYSLAIQDIEADYSLNAKYDFVTNYSSISVPGKAWLSGAVAAGAAIAIINYDMSGYTSRTEAQTMLDVCYTKYVNAINLLRDNKFVAFLVAGTTG